MIKNHILLTHPEIYKSFHKKDCLDYIDLEENPYYKMEFRALRWEIETSFRELKYAVGLTSLHSKKREYITQEIWARLILYNFCEIITAHVVIDKCTQKHVYQVNYTFAIHICRYFISKMVEKSPPDVEALISKEILPVRPGRHDPRKVDHKNRKIILQGNL